MKATAALRNIVLLLAITSGILYLLQGRMNLDFPLVFAGNLLLAITTILSLLLASRGNHANPHAFVRSMYGGTLLKLFLIAAAAAIYIILTDGKVDTGSLGVLGVLYVLYSAIETYSLQKSARQPTPPPQS